MKIKPRRIKKYQPRIRRSNKELQKQQLKDFEHLLDMDLSTYVILSKEGTSKQAKRAQKKAKNDLEKYTRELEKIGSDLGSGFPELIRNYVKSMENVIQKPSQILDPDLINTHRKQAEKLRTKTRDFQP